MESKRRSKLLKALHGTHSITYGAYGLTTAEFSTFEIFLIDLRTEYGTIAKGPDTKRNQLEETDAIDKKSYQPKTFS